MSLWASVSLPANASLSSVWGLATNDVWAVGDNGGTASVADHWDGAAWTSFSTGTTSTLKGVWGAATNDVWAVGFSSTVIHWNGSAWSTVANPGGTYRAIWGFASNDIWAVTDGPSLGTVQHWDGVSWSSVASPADGVEPLFGVWGAASNDVWAVGQSGFVQHWDGSSWTQVSNPFPALTPIQSVFGLASNDVWAVGSGGNIIHWNGSAWSTVSSGTTQTLIHVWGYATNDVWAVGTSGTILHWNGTAWSPQPSGTSTSFVGVWGFGPVDVWNVGGFLNTVLHWQSSPWTLLPAVTTDTLEDAWGSSKTDVHAVGFESTIIHWDGAAWAQTFSQPAGTFNGISGFSTSDIWQVGNSGAIEHWNGSMWNAVSSGVSVTLRGVWGAATSDVWAVGDSGTIRHWNGSAWSASTSGTANALRAVWGSSSTDVYAVGDGGTIRHWNGTAWSTSTSGTAANLFGVFGTSSSDVWAVGSVVAGSATILHFNGTAWSSSPSGTANALLCVWARTTGDAWAAGASGTILHWNGTAWSASTSGTTNPFNGIFGFASNDVWAVATGITKHWNGAAWSTSSGGSGGTSVWGASTSDVWATGDSSFIGNVLKHWDGSTWFLMQNLLTSVWGTAANDVWAVGFNGRLFHYNGTSWSPFAINVSGSIKFNFNGVWGSAPNDVWAVCGGGGAGSGFVLHWGGSSWSLSTTLSGSNDAFAVWGFSSSDVWAAGNGTDLSHWNGSSWSTFAKPTGASVQSLWGAASNDVWAVGTGGNIFHWNGSAWSSASSPTGTSIGGMWGFAANNILAVGGGVGNLVHWDGASWSLVSTGLLSVTSLWGFNASDYWAVGPSGRTYHFLAPLIINALSGQLALSGGFPVVGITHLKRPGFVGSCKIVYPFQWGISLSIPKALYGSGQGQLADGSCLVFGGIDNTDFQNAEANDAFLIAPDGLSYQTVDPIPFLIGDSRSTLLGDLQRRLLVVAGGGQTMTYGAETIPAPGDFRGMWAFSSTNIWVVGQDGGGSVWHWNGSAWSQVGAAELGFGLNAVFGFSANDIWMVGNAGHTQHWNGTSWSTVSSPTSRDLYGLFGTASNELFAVGDHGTIIKWNGSSWSLMTTPVTTDLKDIGGVHASYIAVGLGGTILQSTDFGATWTNIQPGLTSNDLFGVFRADSPSTVIWIVGDNTTTLQSTGGAFSVFNNGLGFSERVSAVRGSSSNNIWATGYDIILFWNGSVWNDPTNSPRQSGQAAQPTRGLAVIDAATVYVVGVNIWKWDSPTDWTQQLPGGVQPVTWTVHPSSSLTGTGDSLVTLPNGNALLMDGASNGVQEFDAASNGWVNRASTQTPHLGGYATTLPGVGTGGLGQVFLHSNFGSAPNNGIPEVYDIGTDTWLYTANLPSAENFCQTQVLLPNGKLFTCGVGSGFVIRADFYDPVTRTFSPLPSQPSAQGEDLFAGARPNAFSIGENLVAVFSNGSPPRVAWFNWSKLEWHGGSFDNNPDYTYNGESLDEPTNLFYLGEKGGTLGWITLGFATQFFGYLEPHQGGFYIERSQAPVNDGRTPTFNGTLTVEQGVTKDRVLVSWSPGSDAITNFRDLNYYVCAVQNSETEDFNSPNNSTEVWAGSLSREVKFLTPDILYYFQVAVRNMLGKNQPGPVADQSLSPEVTFTPTTPGTPISSGFWQFTASMSEARTGPAGATLTDGRYLVWGGGTPGAPALAGDLFSQRGLESLPETQAPTFMQGAFIDASPVVDGQTTPFGNDSFHIDGFHLATQVGGLDNIGVTVPFTEKYFPYTDSWNENENLTTPGNMNEAVYQLAAVPLPYGGILRMGGTTTFGDVSTTTNTVEIFTYGTATVQYFPPAASPFTVGATVVGIESGARGKITALRTGGFLDYIDFTPFNDIKFISGEDVIDTSGGQAVSGGSFVSTFLQTWAFAAPMQFNRAQHSAICLNGYLFRLVNITGPFTVGEVVTGNVSGATATVTAYYSLGLLGFIEVNNVSSNTDFLLDFHLTGNMTGDADINGFVTYRSTKVLVVGGKDETGAPQLFGSEVYDLETDTWTYAGATQTAPHYLFPLVMRVDGRPLAISGGTVVNERYNQDTNVWSTIAPLAATRTEHTAHVFPGTAHVGVFGGRSGGFDNSDVLNDTWGTGPSDVWVVGAHNTAPLANDGVIYHWNGTAWTRQTFNIDPDTRFFAVFGFATNDVFVVGQFGQSMHWDGATWTDVSTGDGISLYCVFGVAGAEIWAIGDLGKIYLWNGSAWVSQTSPTSETLRDMEGIHVGETINYVAVGRNGTIIQYTNTTPTWTIIQPTLAPGIDLLSIARFTSPSFALWICGANNSTYRSTGGAFSAFGNGMSFGGSWADVRGTSSSDVWMIGSDVTQPTGSIAHFNGSSWTLTKPIGDASFLRGLMAFPVSGPANRFVWVVGIHPDPFPVQNAAVYYYNGTSWVNDPLGTEHAGVTPNVLLYDPNSNLWSQKASMNEARARHVSFLMPNNKVLVAGGEDNSAIPSNTAEISPSPL